MLGLYMFKPSSLTPMFVQHECQWERACESGKARTRAPVGVQEWWEGQLAVLGRPMVEGRERGAGRHASSNM